MMSDQRASLKTARRVTTRALMQSKQRGERWVMLTSYDALTAELCDSAGVPALLVGDSAGNTVFGYDNTIPVTFEEMLPLVRSVARGARRSLIVADMPFGSYQSGVRDALKCGM